jgi:hypothetical protein
MKNVARALPAVSARTILFVVVGHGPSSKVSAIAFRPTDLSGTDAVAVACVLVAGRLAETRHCPRFVAFSMHENALEEASVAVAEVTTDHVFPLFRENLIVTVSPAEAGAETLPRSLNLCETRTAIGALSLIFTDVAATAERGAATNPPSKTRPTAIDTSGHRARRNVVMTPPNRWGPSTYAAIRERKRLRNARRLAKA